MTKTQKIIFFTLITITSLLFLMSASLKLIGDAQSAQGFTEIGLPLWVMYVVGAAELLGAIGIWIGVTRRHATRGLAIIMVGAIVLVSIYKSISLSVVPLLVIVILAAICWLDRKNEKALVK